MDQTQACGVNRIIYIMNESRVLLIAYSFAATGANMLRYKSLSSFLFNKGYSVDVVGYYSLNETLPSGISYFQIKQKFTPIGVGVFIALFFRYLYLMKGQRFLSYIRRIGLASLTYSRVICLFNKHHYNACLVSVLPWSYYLIIPLLKKKCRTVIDICDPLYKNALFSNSSSIANFRLEKDSLSIADAIATVNEPTIPILTNEMGLGRDKIEFITPAMNVGDNWELKPMIYEWTHSLRLIYSGSIYAGYRDLSEVQSAIESCTSVSLDIYTNSVCIPKESHAIRVHSIVPHNLLLNLYQQYDVLLFIDNFYGYQVPSKIFELMAQNKPILFVYDRRNTYLYNMLREQTGFFFVENDRLKIETAIKGLISKGSAYVDFNFDLTSYTEESVNQKLLHCLFPNCSINE